VSRESSSLYQLALHAHASSLLHATERLLECPELNQDDLEKETREAIFAATGAVALAKRIATTVALAPKLRDLCYEATQLLGEEAPLSKEEKLRERIWEVLKEIEG
jgi:hypothetical protein